jgi:hypothetical protein
VLQRKISRFVIFRQKFKFSYFILVQIISINLLNFRDLFFFYLTHTHTHTHQGLHKRSTNSNNLFHKSIIKIIMRKYGVKYYIPLFNKHISQIIQRIINLYHDSLINDKSLCALSLFLFWFDCFTVLEIIYNANFKNLCIY